MDTFEIVEWIVVAVVGTLALTYAIGYDRGRTAAELAAQRVGAITYRTPASPRMREQLETLVPPPVTGPVVLEEGPEGFTDRCRHCGTRFSYRLEDVRPPSGTWPAHVCCPKCGKREVHSA